jgi:hypothetical protein
MTVDHFVFSAVSLSVLQSALFRAVGNDSPWGRVSKKAWNMKSGHGFSRGFFQPKSSYMQAIKFVYGFFPNLPYSSFNWHVNLYVE